MRKTLIVIISLVLVFYFSAKFGFAFDLKVENASQQQLNLIKSVLDKGLRVEKSAAVKSTKHRNVYYVGVNFYATGVKDKMTGVWVVGGTKENPNLVYSVNGYAHQFSGMRKASETKAAAYVYDEECEVLLIYLK
jgi:hypothetical protein